MEHWTDVIQVTLTLKPPNYRQITLFSIYILYFIHRKKWHWKVSKRQS